MQKFTFQFPKVKPSQLIIPLILLFVFCGAILGIIKYQAKNKQTAVPKIEITSPADGAEFTDAQIVINGKTSAQNKLTINGKEEPLDKKGAFYSEIPLAIGGNSVVIVSENKAGKKTEKILNVKRKEVVASVSTVTPQSNIVATAPTSAATVGDGKGSLSSSGPESFWLLESAFLSAAGAAWYGTRKKLNITLKK